MIKEDYVSFEVAKLLKEKGFDEPVMYHFTPDGTQRKFQQAFYKDDIAQPTLKMAMKWLRENHKIAIQVFPVLAEDTWCFDVYKKNDEGVWKSEPENLSDVDYESYEECLNAALVYTIENLL